MLYKNLPLEIQKRVDELAPGRTNSNMDGRFVFSSTPEGYDFWHQIRCGNFRVFYQRYPKEDHREIKRALRVNKIPSKYTDEQIKILEEKNINFIK